MEYKNDKVCLQEIWRRQALLREPLKRFGSILWRAFTCRTCILCAVRNGVIWWLFLEFNCIKKNASRHPRLSPFFVPTIKLIWMVHSLKKLLFDSLFIFAARLWMLHGLRSHKDWHWWRHLIKLKRIFFIELYFVAGWIVLQLNVFFF